MEENSERRPETIWSRAAVLSALFLVELVVLAVSYQFFASIECRGTGWTDACTLLRSMVGRAIVVFAASGLIALAWPAAFRQFLAETASWKPAPWVAALHGAGVVLMLAPLALGWGPELGSHFAEAVPFWLGGAVAAGLGGLLWLAPLAAWQRLLSHRGFAVAAVLAGAALLPDLAEAVRPLWDWTLLARLTFGAVQTLLTALGSEVYADPELYQIGVNSALGGFVVRVGQPCSGVEGFALITAFVLLYGWLFRSVLRFPRYWIVVLPLGLLASWVLNVLRITALVLIGAHVSPDLAVNGFHSYAGWLLFTLLTMGVIAVVQVTPWLHRNGVATRPENSVRSDPVAAQILPFIVMMLGGILSSTLLIQPALGYPLVAVSLVVALWFVWPALRHLEVTPDPLALAVGAAIGVLWVALAPAGDTALNDSLLGFGSLAFVLWAGFRLIGTAILVPVVEELFFRGYMLSRLDGPSPWRRGLALAATSLAFALLHGRWIAAGAAGLAFGLLAVRRGRVTDAIQAHAVANLLIALVAMARGDWGLI